MTRLFTGASTGAGTVTGAGAGTVASTLAGTAASSLAATGSFPPIARAAPSASER
jgi:hypothetical protein